MIQEKLLTVSQAAERIGVHPNTLRRWVDDGMVPAVKLPSGHRRFEAAAIDQVVRDMRTTTTTDQAS